MANRRDIDKFIKLLEDDKQIYLFITTNGEFKVPETKVYYTEVFLYSNIKMKSTIKKLISGLYLYKAEREFLLMFHEALGEYISKHEYEKDN